MGNFKRCLAAVGICLMVGMMTTGCEKSAGSYYEEGMEAFHDQDYEQAEEYFAEALKGNQDKAEYYISYGLALMKNEKYEDALKQLKKAVLDKENQIVLENNKAAYRAIGIVYYQMQEYEKAIETLKQALEISELKYVNRDIMLYLTACLEAVGDYNQAVEYYGKIISLEESASVYAKKSLLERKKGDYESAVEDIDRAISMEKENYDLYFQKYYLLKGQEKMEEARKVLERAASLKPKTDGQKYGQSKLYYFLGKTEAAQAGFEKALEAGFSEAGFYLGQIEQEQGNLEKAVEYYVNYIESGRRISSAAVYNQLGLCYMEMEEYQYARDTFSIGLKLNDPDLAQELQFNRIVVYERLGNFDKAYKKAKEYLERYPDDKAMKKEKKFIKTRIK